MPSLGRLQKWVRQLSFIAEPREEVKPTNQCFVTKYLESRYVNLRIIIKIISL